MANDDRGGDDDSQPELTEDQLAKVEALARRLFDLARDGSAELLRYIGMGAPIDMADPDGNTFLMLAAYSGNEALVRELLSRGAAVDAANLRGQTPLAGTAFKGFTAIATALLEAGADPLAGSPTPLQTAEMFERHELAEAMRKRIDRSG